MLTVNVKEVRKNLSTLLNRVETGEEVMITRRGNTIARLVPVKGENDLPSLKEFRGKIRVGKKALSREVIDLREEERY